MRLNFNVGNFKFISLSLYGLFLPHDAMLSAVYAIVVCLCVCHTLVLYQNG